MDNPSNDFMDCIETLILFTTELRYFLWYVEDCLIINETDIEFDFPLALILCPKIKFTYEKLHLGKIIFRDKHMICIASHI